MAARLTGERPMPERTKPSAADLHWLSTLLTGRREIALDVTVQAIAPAVDPSTFFSAWMLAWSRRLVIAKALTAVRQDLVASARRMALRRAVRCAPRSWALDRDTTKSD